LTESRFGFLVNSEFGFAGKSSGLDSWVLLEVTSLLFVLHLLAVAHAILLLSISGFASESASKLNSRIRIWVRPLSGWIRWV